jgi:thiamine pyrophosphokinase
MTIFIFANGDLQRVDWIRPLLAGATAVIAADGGAIHLMKLGRPPDIIIGDMDSLTPQVKEWLHTAGTQFIVHSPAKDETDLELALLYAASAYQEEIWLFGTLGGRLDQTLANVMLLAHPALKERKIRLVDEHQRAWLVNSTTVIRGAKGDTVSLIPLGGDVEIERTIGLSWQLNNETLSFGPARGTSNLMTAGSATIGVRSGLLLCIHSRRSWNR